MTTFNPSNTYGNTYIATTRNFQQDEENLRILLSKNHIEYANSINLKTNGIYDVVEVQTGEQYNNPSNAQTKRFAFRKIFNFGAINAGATLTINHGITGITQFTHTYGEAITSNPDFRCIPYADVAAVTNQISLLKTSTQIKISNGATAPNITSGYVVLEYLKN